MKPATRASILQTVPSTLPKKSRYFGPISNVLLFLLALGANLLFMISCTLHRLFYRIWRPKPQAVSLGPRHPEWAASKRIFQHEGHGAEVVELFRSWDRAPKNLLILISGNPGCVDFYADFATQLGARAESRMGIAAIGHVGQSRSTATEKAPTLREQVEHKIAYVKALHEEYPEATLYLSGHSVGSYMCIEVLKELDHLPIKHSVLLTPTISKIVASQNGQRMYHWMRYMRPAMEMIVRVAKHVPEHMLRRLVVHRMANSRPPRRASSRRSDHISKKDASRTLDLATDFAPRERMAQEALDGVISLLDHRVVRSAMIMGLEEMHVIDERPHDVLTKHDGRLSFLFSPIDAWVPDGEEVELMRLSPKSQAVWTGEHVPHAFVLRHAEEIAEITWKLLSPHVE